VLKEQENIRMAKGHGKGKRLAYRCCSKRGKFMYIPAVFVVYLLIYMASYIPIRRASFSCGAQTCDDDNDACLLGVCYNNCITGLECIGNPDFSICNAFGSPNEDKCADCPPGAASDGITCSECIDGSFCNEEFDDDDNVCDWFSELNDFENKRLCRDTCELVIDTDSTVGLDIYPGVGGVGDLCVLVGSGVDCDGHDDADFANFYTGLEPPFVVSIPPLAAFGYCTTECPDGSARLDPGVAYSDKTCVTCDPGLINGCQWIDDDDGRIFCDDYSRKVPGYVYPGDIDPDDDDEINLPTCSDVCPPESGFNALSGAADGTGSCVECAGLQPTCWWCNSNGFLCDTSLDPDECVPLCDSFVKKRIEPRVSLRRNTLETINWDHVMVRNNIIKPNVHKRDLSVRMQHYTRTIMESKYGSVENKYRIDLYKRQLERLDKMFISGNVTMEYLDEHREYVAHVNMIIKQLSEGKKPKPIL